MSKEDAAPPGQLGEALNCGAFQKDVVMVTHALCPVGSACPSGLAVCSLPEPASPPGWGVGGHQQARRVGGMFFGGSWKGLRGHPAQMRKLRPRGAEDLRASGVRLGALHVELQTRSPCDISSPRFALVVMLGCGGHLFTRFFHQQVPESDLLRPRSSRQGPAGTRVPGEGRVIRTDREAGPARCSFSWLSAP